jgi:hypothetical protein
VVNADGELRDGAWVTELISVDLDSRPREPS